MITTVLLLAHVILALVLIVLILLQHGKGADAGAAFGSGASSTVFGAHGAASFMSRATKWLAILFFITSGSLAWLASRDNAPAPSVMEDSVMQETTPAAEPMDDDLPPLEAPVEQEKSETATDEESGAASEDEAQEEDAPPPGTVGN